MVECTLSNKLVVGLSPVAVTLTSAIMPVLSKKFLYIQETAECTFTLKHGWEMIRTHTLIRNFVKVKHNFYKCKNV